MFDSIPIGKAYTCWPVITEATYLLRKRSAQRGDLLQAILDGDLLILKLRERDIESVRDVFAKYRDHDIDLADACLLHFSNREGINAVFTLDRRHFSMFRKHDRSAFRLLPE